MEIQKFSGITYPKLKTRNLQMTTNYIYMEKKSTSTNDGRRFWSQLYSNC